MRTSNYDKFPCVEIPNSSGACVTGWEPIGERLGRAVARRVARKTVVIVECYAGVDEHEVLGELQSRLRPVLVRHVAAAMRSPDAIDGLVAPFLGGDDPVFGFLSGLMLPQFFEDGIFLSEHHPAIRIHSQPWKSI